MTDDAKEQPPEIGQTHSGTGHNISAETVNIDASESDDALISGVAIDDLRFTDNAVSAEFNTANFKLIAGSGRIGTLIVDGNVFGGSKRDKPTDV